MDAEQARQVIERAGGDENFAKLLHIDNRPGYQQRVNNWKRRGIPARVLLEHGTTISALASSVVSVAA